jgi:uncharacterized membrane protein YdbT with pleckstrin-like domain
MPAMQIRASTKFIKLGYILCLLVAIAIAVVMKTMTPVDDRLWWLEIVPAFLMILLIMRHLKRLLVKLEITNDHVRYESGLFSKMTRTEDVTKLQDVQVHQTLGQRMMGIGDLSFETAGASSPIVMHSIDKPQVAADYILQMAKAQRLRPDAGPAASHGAP